MKKSILKILILITITPLILLFFVGCKSPESTEFEERIEALEGDLVKKEAEEAIPEEKRKDSPAIITDTEQVEEVPTFEEEPGDEDADADADKEAPTISLVIYEGPILNGSICYYRIEAIVTGSPSPSVSFSKDDSVGAWGSKKVQINLNDPNDTYNLTATAINSEGSSTDSITLSWGCAIPQGNDMLRSHSAGEVTIDVEYMGYNENLLSFNITMNTHSVDLDQYDLAQLSELTDDKGNIYTPLSWNSMPGGHHRYGILTFSQPGSESGPDTLKLVIRNIAEIQERTFVWESIPVNL